MDVWKANFPNFQPPENRFYPTMSGIKPGEVLLIEAKVPPLPGHAELPAGSNRRDGALCRRGDVHGDVPRRAPAWQAGTPSALTRKTARWWHRCRSRAAPAIRCMNSCSATWAPPANRIRSGIHVLTSLAQHLGVKGQVVMNRVLIDPGVQWSESKNIWKNAAIRTVFYVATTPVRWFRRPAAKSNG